MILNMAERICLRLALGPLILHPDSFEMFFEALKYSSGVAISVASLLLQEFMTTKVTKIALQTVICTPWSLQSYWIAWF
jgi:hypothetical protein